MISTAHNIFNPSPTRSLAAGWEAAGDAACLLVPLIAGYAERADSGQDLEVQREDGGRIVPTAARHSQRSGADQVRDFAVVTSADRRFKISKISPTCTITVEAKRAAPLQVTVCRIPSALFWRHLCHTDGPLLWIMSHSGSWSH